MQTIYCDFFFFRSQNTSISNMHMSLKKYLHYGTGRMNLSRYSVYPLIFTSPSEMSVADLNSMTSDHNCVHTHLKLASISKMFLKKMFCSNILVLLVERPPIAVCSFIGF